MLWKTYNILFKKKQFITNTNLIVAPKLKEKHYTEATAGATISLKNSKFVVSPFNNLKVVI